MHPRISIQTSLHTFKGSLHDEQKCIISRGEHKLQKAAEHCNPHLWPRSALRIPSTVFYHACCRLHSFDFRSAAIRFLLCLCSPAATYESQLKNNIFTFYIQVFSISWRACEGRKLYVITHTRCILFFWGGGGLLEKALIFLLLIYLK